MTIFDEHRVVWRVEAGDPARPLINRLRKLHYDVVVLPRQVLITGELGEPVAEPDPRTAPGDLPYALRMADCNKELQHASDH